MPTRLFNRLSDFHLSSTLALKAMFDKILTQVETQYDSIAANITSLAAQLALIQTAQNTADAAQLDADAALTTLTNIASDSILDPSEKAQLIPIVQNIINEKSGLDSQATTLGITTEKTAYDNEYTTLTNYLNGLSPAYTDTTQNTTIVRATFNTRFQDFYSDRQALLNKMTDVASAQSVVIDPFADVIIYADSAGTIKTGELTREAGLTASKGASEVTTLGTWSRTVTSGITCTIGAATGIVAITAFTSSEVFVPISFVYLGVTRTATLHVVRQDDPPTQSGGGGGGSGGTTASTTTLTSATSTSYGSGESAILTVTASSAGKVQCSAPIAFKRTPGTVAGETGALGKWQWRALAGSFADITTEVADTGNAETIVNAGDPTLNLPGSLPVTMTKTGLTAATDYEFKFLWRKTDVAGDVDSIYRSSGTLTADGTVA